MSSARLFKSALNDALSDKRKRLAKSGGNKKPCEDSQLVFDLQKMKMEDDKAPEISVPKSTVASTSPLLQQKVGENVSVENFSSSSVSATEISFNFTSTTSSEFCDFSVLTSWPLSTEVVKDPFPLALNSWDHLLATEENTTIINPPVSYEAYQLRISSSESCFSTAEEDSLSQGSSVQLQNDEFSTLDCQCHMQNQDWFADDDLKLDNDHLSSEKSLTSYTPSQLRNLATDVGFIDTHCHLDFLLKRAEHYGTYASYCKKMKDSYPLSYEGCVANFCDPDTFHKKSFWQPLIEEKGVWAAFGCHPHHATRYSEKVDEALIVALQHKKVVALGEIGLDYSDRNHCDRKIQHRVFRRQLVLAVQMKLPLVIHSRNADMDCLQIMREIVPDNHPIHLHCFRSSWSIAKLWLDNFPKLFIGITNCITYPSATKVHDVVKNVPLDRLLLETDAPYFLPSTMPKSMKWSHPGMAIHVAARITALRCRETLEETLQAIRQNTKFMYGI